MPDDLQPVAPPMPDASGLPASGAMPAPLPVRSQQQTNQARANQPPQPRPILMSLIQGLMGKSKQMDTSTGAEVMRPVSRLDTFENFLGNFVTALGAGMSAAHGPGAFAKGA